MTLATEAWFRGRWQMVRIIENVTEGVIGEFWGECSFTPDGTGLTCRESGVLRFRGADYSACRVSLWRFPDAGRIEVRYEDGRPFHDFAPELPEATHLCGADRYRVSYDFEHDSWLSRWEVAGPQKDYVMTTRYRRVREPECNSAGTGKRSTVEARELLESQFTDAILRRKCYVRP